MDNKLLENICYLLWDTVTYSDLREFFSSKTQPTAVQYFNFVLFIVTCIIGYAGNITVILVTGFLMKKNKYKIWFLNLAVADVLFLLFLPLDAVAELKGRWPYGSAVCKFYYFLSSVNMNAGIYILTALNIDRALSVAKPVWHMSFYSRRFCFCILSVIWISSVICSIPVFIYSDVHEAGADEEGQCSLTFSNFNFSGQMSSDTDFDVEHFSSRFSLFPREDCKIMFDFLQQYKRMEFVKLWKGELFTLMYIVVPLSVFGYLIPLCIILFSNAIIALHVKNSRMAASSRLYRLIIIEIMSFFCTRTPFVLAFITFLVAFYTMQFTLLYKIYIIMPLLNSISAVNSCLNPVVYVLVGKQVRSEIMTFFKKT